MVWDDDGEGPDQSGQKEELSNCRREVQSPEHARAFRRSLPRYERRQECGNAGPAARDFGSEDSEDSEGSQGSEGGEEDIGEMPPRTTFFGRFQTAAIESFMSLAGFRTSQSNVQDAAARAEMVRDRVQPPAQAQVACERDRHSDGAHASDAHQRLEAGVDMLKIRSARAQMVNGRQSKSENSLSRGPLWLSGDDGPYSPPSSAHSRRGGTDLHGGIRWTHEEGTAMMAGKHHQSAENVRGRHIAADKQAAQDHRTRLDTPPRGRERQTSAPRTGSVARENRQRDPERVRGRQANRRPDESGHALDVASTSQEQSNGAGHDGGAQAGGRGRRPRQSNHSVARAAYDGVERSSSRGGRSENRHRSFSLSNGQSRSSRVQPPAQAQVACAQCLI